MTNEECRGNDKPIVFDIVTPTRNRALAIVEQAKRLGAQMLPCDRWIIVDDASNAKPHTPTTAGAWHYDVSELMLAFESSKRCDRSQLELLDRMYLRGDGLGTVQKTRHIACSMSRADAWIVDADDHDLLHPEALDRVRAAIAAGAVFVYGDTQWVQENGTPGEIFTKENYRPWLLRDSHCPCEGLRAYPARLYRDVGGFRWEGRVGFVNECEFPAGDYGLFLRMELAIDGEGFVRVPHVLSDCPKVSGGISCRYQGEQSQMAGRLRRAAAAGLLAIPPISEPLETFLKREN